MAQLKLRVKKAGTVNPVTKKKGFSTRVLTNGTAAFEEIVAEAGHNTTMHKAELRMAFELCLDSVTSMLKQGMIVDLGPLGKIYPSCSSGWYEKEEDMRLADVKPTLYFRPASDVEAAVKGAQLVWAKTSDQEAEEEAEGGTTSGGSGSGNSGSGGYDPVPSGDDSPGADNTGD
ncbi:MAG: hypothetical protein IJ067_06235 [Prevotella sp.]|nr:hypothetical protein [Prevotella sp.]